MIYWLYYNNQPLTAVNLPPNASDEEVKEKALDQHHRVPLCAPIPPYEHEQMILWAEVRL